MIRLSTNEEGGKTVITVDGQLLSDHIEVIEDCCSRAMLGGKPVQLFLQDVSSVDQTGRSMLRRLVAKGIEIRAAGVHASYHVDAVHSEMVTEPASGAVERTANQVHYVPQRLEAKTLHSRSVPGVPRSGDHCGLNDSRDSPANAARLGYPATPKPGELGFKTIDGVRVFDNGEASPIWLCSACLCWWRVGRSCPICHAASPQIRSE
jgi:hypothetical protein